MPFKRQILYVLISRSLSIFYCLSYWHASKH